MKYIDLRSDTVTQPTEEMRLAMYNAIVDDDVYGDDPTVNKLEKMAAELLGKEAALFIPSGTMGNQIAIMTHTKLGDEIILGSISHIAKYEVGAAARLSGVSYALINNDDYKIYKKDIENSIRTKDVHFPDTGLICIENPLTNGEVLSIDHLKEIYEIAKSKNIPVHLDGARIFNAAQSLSVDVKDISRYADSVMFCLSKGLCSPIGSILCGTTEFIEKARRNRKILGGGMRQVGVIAACGIISLEKMINRLGIDHENAKYLAENLSKIDGFEIDLNSVQTNMLFFDIKIPNFNHKEFASYLLEKGIKINDAIGDNYRLVTNHDVTKESVIFLLECINHYINS